MPSFAEGYGLPIVEALSLQTPVVCSDIPVFREVKPRQGPGPPTCRRSGMARRHPRNSESHLEPAPAIGFASKEIRCPDLAQLFFLIRSCRR